MSPEYRRGITMYHISSRRCLCSATSPGRVAKSASSADICEMRFSIRFLTTTVSCRPIRKRRISNRQSQANLMIRINPCYGPKDSPERTESICGLLCDTVENGGSPSLAVSPRDWWALTESGRHTGIGTHPSTPSLVHLPPLLCYRCFSPRHQDPDEHRP